MSARHHMDTSSKLSFQKKTMKRALVLTNALNSFAGSEVLVLEVAETLEKLGFSVDVHCNLFSNKMKRSASKMLSICDSDEFPNIFNYEFVWSQHSVLALAIGAHDIPKHSKTKIISVHLSPTTPLELIGFNTAKLVGATFLANSNETLQKLIALGVPKSEMINFYNACPNAYSVEEISVNTTPKKILIVSNHAPYELINASNILKKSGFSVKIIGKNFRRARVLPRDIQNADAVISIGKTVQYALQASKPVFCYDHFGGPGWLNKENFLKAEAFNFSGRCCSTLKSANQIANEIISGFESASKFRMLSLGLSSSRYSLEQILIDLVGDGSHHFKYNSKNSEFMARLEIEIAQAKLIRQLYRRSNTVKILARRLNF